MSGDILVADNPRYWERYRELLRESLGYDADVIWPVDGARKLFDRGDYKIVIVEPFSDSKAIRSMRIKFLRGVVEKRVSGIVVSTAPLSFLESQGLGRDDYNAFLRKPFKFHELSEVIGGCLEE